MVVVKMPELCDKSQCTGCAGCVNACPVQCISLKPDDMGRPVPVIDEKKCISCKKCVSVCPVINQASVYDPIKCFAAMRKDVASLKRCASGGVATLLMEYYIQQENWSVYSTCLNSELVPEITEICSKQDIEKCKGSLYVQSQTGRVFQNILAALKKGRNVLFIGTPCQVAALIMYTPMGYRNNLYCCDLFCHGVVPYSYLKDELNYLKQKDITSVTFRGYDVREDHWFITWNGTKKIYAKSGLINYYSKAFYDCVSLRENCFYCRYAQSKRCGDLSLGDFLGLDKKSMEHFRNNCVTAILLNTEKGSQLLTNIIDLLKIDERPYAEAVAGGASLQKPSIKPESRSRFEKKYRKTHNFAVSIRKTIKKEMCYAKIRRIFRYVRNKLS